MNCIDCIWRDKCPGTEVCDDYTPYDVEMDTIIEEGRTRFHEEWNEYINDLHL